MSALKRYIHLLLIKMIYVVRVPYEVDDVMEILISLSQDEYSANNVHSLLLNEMNWYTEELPITLKCYRGPEKGTLRSLEDRILFENGNIFEAICDIFPCLF